MKDAIKDILHSYKGMVSEELITRYIRGQATKDEVRHLELLMHDDPFLADAIEGLKDGDYASHKNNIELVKASLYKKKTGFVKISIASVAVAASLVLICYWGFKYSSLNLKQTQESSTSVAMDSVGVQKETKIITLNKPEPLAEETKAEPQVIDKQKQELPLPIESYDNSPHKPAARSTAHVDELKANAGNAAKPSKRKTHESTIGYVSKDKSSDKKAANVLNEGEMDLEMDDASELPNSNMEVLEKSTTAPQSVKSLVFNELASNTKDFLLDMAPHPEGRSDEYKISAKKRDNKPKCENCPDKAIMAEKNAVLDTIATHKAAYLYEMGAYEEAAKWYARNPDTHSKIMAGLSYLQAGDTAACKNIELVLSKSNTAATDLVKSLRMSYSNKNTLALAGFQKLIDNNSVFKALAERNKQVITSK